MKTRSFLTTFFCLCFTLLVLNACEPTSKKGEWIPADKQKFLNYCKEARKAKDIQLSEAQINAVCDCALKKSIQAYESFYEANADAIKLIGKDCIEKIKQ